MSSIKSQMLKQVLHIIIKLNWYQIQIIFLIYKTVSVEFEFIIDILYTSTVLSEFFRRKKNSLGYIFLKKTFNCEKLKHLMKN